LICKHRRAKVSSGQTTCIGDGGVRKNIIHGWLELHTKINCTRKIREPTKRKYGNLAVNKSIGFSIGCSILHDRLNTKDLQRKSFFLTDYTCDMCNETALEIRLHLLFHCPFAQACLLEVYLPCHIFWDYWFSFWLPGQAQGTDSATFFLKGICEEKTPQL
jgi:hypothetical protein